MTGPPMTLCLVQIDDPPDSRGQKPSTPKIIRRIYFADLARWPRRFPGCQQVDPRTLGPLSKCNGKRTADGRFAWERERRYWRATWQADLAKRHVPIRKRIGFGLAAIRGRFNDYLEPRIGRAAILRSELEIVRIPHDLSWTHLSYLHEAMIKVDVANQIHAHTLAPSCEVIACASIAPVVQLDAGLESLWQRVWFLHQHNPSESHKYLDGVDVPLDARDCVNHWSIAPGIESESWDGTLSILDQDYARRRPVPAEGALADTLPYRGKPCTP